MAVLLALEDSTRNTAVLEEAGADETSRASFVMLVLKLSTLAERECLPPMIAIFGEAIVGNLSIKGVEEWVYSRNDSQVRIGVAVQEL